MRTEIILSGSSLSLYNDQPINISYKQSDIKNFGTRSDSHSYAFNVPADVNNNKIFSHLYNLNSNSTFFDINKKQPVTVLVDSQIVLEGQLQLTNINEVLKDNTADYKVVIYSNGFDINTKLQDKTFKDLPFNYNIIKTSSEVLNSWMFYNNYPLIFSIIDRGYSWSYSTINSSRPIESSEIKPTFKVKYLFDNILSGIGKSYTSTFLNSDYFKNFLVDFGDTSTQGTVHAKFRYFYTSEPADRDVTVYLTKFKNGVRFDDYLELQNDLIPVGASGFITVDLKSEITLYDGEQLGVYFELQTPTGNLATSFDIGTTNIADEEGFKITWNDPVYSDANIYVGNSSLINIAWNHTPYAEQTVKWDITTGGGFVDIFGNYNITTGIYSIIKFPVKRYLPLEYKQSEFFNSVIKTFNLVIDEADDGKLLIEPYIDYRLNSTVPPKTWEIDSLKEIDIKLLSELQNKNIQIGYSESNDHLNEFYKKTYNQVYGTYYNSFQNDFTEGTKVITNGFGIAINQNLVGSQNFVIPRIYNSDDNGTVNSDLTTQQYNPKLLYWGGFLNLSGETFKINYFDEGLSVQYAAYGYCGEVDHPFYPTHSITYDTPKSIYWNLSGYPQTNLNSKFYERNIDEISDKNSKILTAYFKLSSVDIANFKFSDTIFIPSLNSYWTVNKIDYNALGTDLTKVELIKLNKNLPIRDKKLITIGKLSVNPTKSFSTSDTNRVGNLSIGNGVKNNSSVNSEMIFVNGSANTIYRNVSYTNLLGVSNLIGSSGSSIFIKGDRNYTNPNSTNISILNGNDNNVSGNNITIINQNGLTSTTSNSTYIGGHLILSGVEINQYWTAGTGNNSLIRYPNQNVTGTGVHSIITAGKFQNSTLANTYGFIGNGLSCTTTYNFGSILNGKSNYNGGYFGMIVNGSQNRIGGSGAEAFIGNGSLNYAAWNRATVVNGLQNNATSVSSFIANGKQNQIVNGKYSSIINGFGNIITGNTSYAFIANGSANIMSNANYSFIAGGINNRLYNASYSFLNGTNNRINNASAVNRSKHNTIFGHSNYINSYYGFNSILSQTSSIKDNTIGVWGTNNAILAGAGNKIYSTSNSIILGGTNITIDQKSNVAVLSLSNFTANTNDRVYIPSLYVKDLTGGTQYVVSNNGVLQLTAGSISVSSVTTPNYWEQSGGTKSIKLTGWSGSINSLSDYSINASYNSNINNGDYNSIVGGSTNILNGEFCSLIGGSGNTILGSNSFNSIINSNVSVVNGKDSYETIIGSNNCSITGDSGYASIINSKDSIINLTGSNVFFTTLIGVSAYTHNNTNGIDHITVVDKFKHLGSVYSKNKTAAASYTVTEFDYLVNVKTDAAYTITLPTSPKDGMQLFIKDYYGSGSINNITVESLSINIDTATTFLIDKDYAALHLMYCSNLNIWVILNYYF